MTRLLACLAALCLAGCGGYHSLGLRPGEARLADVLERLGPPQMEWAEADGSRVLVFPRGPMGPHTYFATIAADGSLARIENVLLEERLGRVRPGMSREAVLRAIGPPESGWTRYYPARDELAWEWAYCNQGSRRSHFYVLFDGHQGPVRSTFSILADQLHDCQPGVGCWCGQ